jgi:hypothetical protein
MRNDHSEKRVIFAIACEDQKKIGEAKFKMADLHAGFGKFDKICYCSLPPDQSQQGYQVLKSIFKDVQLFHSN